MKNRKNMITTILLALGVFGLLPRAQAVSSQRQTEVIPTATRLRARMPSSALTYRRG